MNSGITPKPDLKEGFHTLSVMEAMQRCLETGTPICIADVLAGHSIQADWLKVSEQILLCRRGIDHSSTCAAFHILPL